MAWLALGYFLAYIPYAMLVKAMSSGISPLTDGPVDGLVLLPAAALGQLAAMPLFLTASGWWRYGRQREIPGVGRVRVPGRQTLLAGLFTSLIIGTTTLNFTFSGVSILLVLLLMRGGVLILSPLVDSARKRSVSVSAWAAFTFSLLAVSVALGDVDSYHLTLATVLSVLVYLIGYVGRFEIMSRVAKTGVKVTDRRYFVEEHAAAPVFLVGFLAAAALAGQPELRTGFTTFLGTPAAWMAVGIGVAYEILFVFGTLIYLDRRVYTWCVPANRCASLLSGLVASYALAGLAGLPVPGNAQLLALVFIGVAIVSLSYPATASWWWERGLRARRVLFVCGGNTSRSPMAEVIARAHAAQAGDAARRVSFASAGVSPARSGAPLAPAARAALADLGIRRVPGPVHPRRHRARSVTPQLCRSSSVIYCMTRAHRDAVLALVPDAEHRTHCLDPHGDVPNPEGQPPDVYRQCAHRIDELVRTRLHEFLGGDPGPDVRSAGVG
ncbi:arsenate reductase/protein-tyrosine-phosphatase family protein [Streptomyces sp. NPDC002643]